MHVSRVLVGVRLRGLIKGGTRQGSGHVGAGTWEVTVIRFSSTFIHLLGLRFSDGKGQFES